MVLDVLGSVRVSELSQSVELGLFFVIGLFGAAHCLGMCGPLVSFYSDRLNARRDEPESTVTWFAVRQHLLFNLGRATIYALLGGFFGLLGGVFFTTADLAIPFGDEIRGSMGILVGLIVAAAGAGYLFGRHNAVLSGELPILGPVFQRIHSALLYRVDDWVGGPKIFALGFVHGFLPCPLLYPAFLYALALGDPVGGALALGTLGAGTFPAVFLYGTLYQSTGLRRHVLVHRLLGGAFALLGLHTVLMGLSVLGFDVPRLFSLPFYQPLLSTTVEELPTFAVLSVATIGSLLLLGAAVKALYYRRSWSYFLITLALVAVAVRTATAELAFLGLVDDGVSSRVGYLSDAAMVLFVIAAVLLVRRLKHTITIDEKET